MVQCIYFLDPVIIHSHFSTSRLLSQICLHILLILTFQTPDFTICSTLIWTISNHLQQIVKLAFSGNKFFQFEIPNFILCTDLSPYITYFAFSDPSFYYLLNSYLNCFNHLQQIVKFAFPGNTFFQFEIPKNELLHPSHLHILPDLPFLAPNFIHF